MANELSQKLESFKADSSLVEIPDAIEAQLTLGFSLVRLLAQKSANPCLDFWLIETVK